MLQIARSTGLNYHLAYFFTDPYSAGVKLLKLNCLNRTALPMYRLIGLLAIGDNQMLLSCFYIIYTFCFDRASLLIGV